VAFGCCSVVILAGSSWRGRCTPAMLLPAAAGCVLL
jgi:hypothetical protein